MPGQPLTSAKMSGAQKSGTLVHESYIEIASLTPSPTALVNKLAMTNRNVIAVDVK